MQWLKELAHSLSSIFRRSDKEQQLHDELQFHLERQIEQNLAAGMPPKEARYAALRLFGGVQQIKEGCRDMRQVNFIETTVQDVRFGLRMIRKNPGFTATALLSLAIGIGANTAIFSLIDALLLRMLPVRGPQQLVQVLCIQDGRRIDSLSYPAVHALQERADRFSGISGFSGAAFNAGPPGGVEKTPGAWVTGDFYQTLGVAPALGRTLTPQDDVPGATPVAVISYRYWEGKYSRDPAALGRELLVEGTPVVIVGVSAKGFSGANVGEAADITLPLA